jgi:phage repressor protein C with HTH and peptisase S24 domain
MPDIIQKSKKRRPNLAFEGSRSSTKRQKALTHDPSKKSREKHPQIDKSSDERKNQEKAPKITKKGKRERHIQALRNHAESSIHTKEVHTRSSLPPDHPSLSQDLTMKLSS